MPADTTHRLPLRFAPPRGGRVDVLVIAGEHSGDEQAARMVSSLLERHPGLHVCALGGRQLEAVGAQLLLDLTSSSVVGLVEVLKNLSYFRGVFAATRTWIREHRPRVVCFVDYPGFNLRLAKALNDDRLASKSGGPVRLVYYISPQIWAWKSRRRFEMARLLDGLAVIFPFELKCYEDTTLPVSFVGHPFVSEGFLSPVAFGIHAPVLLLAGSRRQAVTRIAPALLDGFLAFRRQRPDVRAVMMYPSMAIRAVLEHAIHARPALDGSVALQPNTSPCGASAVLTSSGTMSLVCALAGIPGAIAYRANPLTYFLGRRLVKVSYLGIANILLPEPMYPEFLQGAATPAALAAELLDCLENPERIERTFRLAGDLRNLLIRPPRGDAASWLFDQIAQTNVPR